MPLCDTALRLVQRDLYAVRWTDEILDEAERNLVALGRYDQERIKRRFAIIRDQFSDGQVTGYENLIPVMRCDSKDRHVVAAAVVGGAHQIVTANVSDFPEASVTPYGIEVIKPDAFLLNSLDMAPTAVADVIRAQAAALKRPPMNTSEVLAALSKAGAPEFAQAIENIRAVQGNGS